MNLPPARRLRVLMLPPQPFFQEEASFIARALKRFSGVPYVYDMDSSLSGGGSVTNAEIYGCLVPSVPDLDRHFSPIRDANARLDSQPDIFGERAGFWRLRFRKPEP